jgi:hypothetical protein
VASRADIGRDDGLKARDKKRRKCRGAWPPFQGFGERS